MSKPPRRETFELEDGECWFVGADHEGELQLYNYMDVGPRNTSEMRDWLNQCGFRWLTALAADHFGISLDSVVSRRQFQEYTALRVRASDETEPWKRQAQACAESAAMACKLIDRGDFETAMIYVASTIHTAHGAHDDKQAYEAMLKGSQSDKGRKKRAQQAKSDMEIKKRYARERVEEVINSTNPLPNKTTLDDFLLDNYKDKIPARDELKKTTSKHLKNLKVKLPRHSTVVLDIKKPIT